MMKRLLFVATMLVAGSIIAQTNANVENWTGGTPDGWSTWISAGLQGLGGPATIYEETTDPGQGTSSARLLTEACAVCPTYQLTDPLTGVMSQSLPFTQMPTSLDFMYKANVMTNDTGAVVAQLTHWDGMQTVVDAQALMMVSPSENTTTWSTQSAPFVYITTDTPDTLRLTMVSSMGGFFNQNAAVAGSELFIDEISLGGIVGVNTLEELAELNVYPNPANNLVNFDIDSDQAKSIQIFSIEGQLVDNIAINQSIETLDVSAYTGGLYFYVVLNEQGAVLRKDKFTVAR